jgi:signal recognition particle subunit SRP68
MEKKTAVPNPKQRIYMLSRFRKAVKWATLFSHLCSVKGDSRTSLEAEVCSLLYFVRIVSILYLAIFC